MANFFLDCEFYEGFHKPLFGRRRHFIDLISIALVAEDGREFYEISNEFDLKEASKDEWLRSNVLTPIYNDLLDKENVRRGHLGIPHLGDYYSGQYKLKDFKYLLDVYGKSNKQICGEIQVFTGRRPAEDKFGMFSYYWPDKPEFYAYYADYDWVLFCSLFGRMIDLPPEFPQYCRDLKQTSDFLESRLGYDKDKHGKSYLFKEHLTYPKQVDEHNALADARWNHELYKFLDAL